MSKIEELIRKQDALDAFNGEITVVAARNAGRVYTYLKMVTDRIKALPPVYVPDTNVGDMISRKMAMEMLMAQNVIMDGSEYHNGFNAGVNRAQEVIRNLPTVQPKHGKWIERGTWSEGYGMGETYGKYWACNQCGREVKGFWGECGKNFCDNCGADMRGGEE